MRSDLQSDAIATMRHSQLNLHILKDSNPDQTGWNRLCYRYTKDTFFLSLESESNRPISFCRREPKPLGHPNIKFVPPDGTDPTSRY
jgi:hypothetical protein